VDPAPRPLPGPGPACPGPAWSRGARVSGPLRRAALPLQLQLSRRGEPPRGARRGGRPSRPGCDRDYRPRRHVRGGALRRGRPGARRQDGVRCGAQPRARRTAQRRPRPGGRASAGAGPRPGRLPQVVPHHQRRPPAGPREGQAGLRPGAGGGRGGGALGGAHRLPQGGSAPGAGARRSRRSRVAAAAPGRAVRSGARARRAHRPRPAHRHRAQRRAGRTRGRGRPGHRGHHRGALRHAVAAPARYRTHRGPRPAQPGRDGRLAAPGRHRSPALRRGDGGPVRALARRSGPRRGAGQRVCLPAAAGGPGPASVRRPRRSHRGDPAARARLDRHGAALRLLRRAPGGLPPDLPRARGDRGQGLLRLLPHRQ
jgi:hypothetical protein